MFELLWLIPALPLAGFIVLALLGGVLAKRAVALVGAGSVGAAAIVSMGAAVEFISAPPPANSVTQVLWAWMEVGLLRPHVALYLDALSVTIVLVVTVVGFLILLYSAEFMGDDESYARFFAYMDLFVGSMLILVLADNLLFLYLGWEGVGLCSYLLIGFWYKERENSRAAMKAFIVTRVGDVGLAVGLFFIFSSLGTLHIQDVMHRAAQEWAVGSTAAMLAAALLLCGAVGKSAQVPLQTWLPDAMAGPTPVSALIHAATMVTAGVYLIARTNGLFSLAPAVQSVVALIGVATLLLGGLSALAQRDIKRVLAYSTMSQIGYMFLALGVGAWSAAIFHFATHAFFKALLFLGAGSVLLATDEQRDMTKLGGLRADMPYTFWTFVVGASSLAALPLVTAGFYSKDMMLWNAWTSPMGSPWLWLGGALGALITGLYAFRMVFLTFLGERKTAVIRRPGLVMYVPMGILAALSIFSGFLETPGWLGGMDYLSPFLGTALPGLPHPSMQPAMEFFLQGLTSLLCVSGVLAAYFLFVSRPDVPERIAASKSGAWFREFWFFGWGFDRAYELIVVKPFVWIALVNRDDVVDSVFTELARVNEALYSDLSETQTGKLRNYAFGMAAGAALAIGIMVLL
ncbi:MAG: NADH-quinone oxidoreductase subunit L [Thermodesulfobacteriota bacterium]